uniref:RPA43 OB domain-containing protein n=1 Tax=Clastoptera arizonana TaxID=38151 RepID=A0A1B6CVW1_9HEMI
MTPKQIISLKELKRLVKDENSSIEFVKNYYYQLILAPNQFHNTKKCISDNLRSLIMTYDVKLDGIVMNFKNVKIRQLASLKAEINVTVDCFCDLYIFKPEIERILKGVINKKSEDHVGCLVHRYFNVTIPHLKQSSEKNWSDENLKIGSEILFKVSRVNLRKRLPYIQGRYISSFDDGKGIPNDLATTNGNSDTSESTFRLTPYDKISQLLNPTSNSSDKERIIKKKLLGDATTSLNSVKKRKHSLNSNDDYLEDNTPKRKIKKRKYEEF